MGTNKIINKNIFLNLAALKTIKNFSVFTWMIFFLTTDSPAAVFVCECDKKLSLMFSIWIYLQIQNFEFFISSQIFASFDKLSRCYVKVEIYE